MRSSNRQHPSARLRLCLTVSLGVHILLFGTALAFARYGEFFFPGGSRFLTIDLVSEGGSSGAGSSPDVRKRPPVRPYGRDVMTEVKAGEGMVAEEKVSEEKVGEDPFTPAVHGISQAAGADAEGPSVSREGEQRGLRAGLDGSDGATAGAALREQWRMLQSALEKAKTYPRLARERGIEGTVLVRFKVRPSGDVEAVDVIRSSGTQILDEASVRTVYRAAPMPYVSGWVEVPMVYELK